MDRKDSTPPIRELQVNFKTSMRRKLEKIAKIEGVDDPTTLVLLQTARLIREKKDESRARGICF